MLRGRSDDQMKEAGEGERRQRRIKSNEGLTESVIVEELKIQFVI